MNDRVNVLIVVPEINNVFLPINKKIGTIVGLLNKGISELSNNDFPIEPCCKLYNGETLELYNYNVLLYNTDIRNGTKLVLLSN